MSAGRMVPAVVRAAPVEGLAGMMPTFTAPWRELASQPMTPTHSACSDTDAGDVPVCGAQITQRNTR